MTPGAWLSSTPSGVALCPIDDLPDPGARNFVLETSAGRFHGFVVRSGAMVRGYVDRCPHLGFPLAKILDAYLTPRGDLIACSWHGALFQIADGECVGGPCVGARLAPWPVALDRGVIRTGANIS